MKSRWGKCKDNGVHEDRFVEDIMVSYCHNLETVDVR